LTTNEEKVGLVEICTVYDVAVAEEFHVNVGFTAMPVAVSCGETSVGAAGGAMAVVNLNAEEKALVPPAFVALARQ
jgi:hypothetical protein